MTAKQGNSTRRGFTLRGRVPGIARREAVREMTMRRSSFAAATTLRWAVVTGAVLAAAFAVALSSAAAFADSPGRLVSKGNRQYQKKDFTKALDLYDKASVKAPESAIIAFNKGDAFYKKEDYEKAREQFQQAASATKSLPLEAKAWYNLGNVSFKEGGRQEDSDLQKALESYQESVKHYGTALDKDPGLRAAAENMEIARLKIKDLLDKIKNQQQNQKGQQNQQNQQSQENQQQQQQQGQQQEQNQQQNQEQQQGQNDQQKEQQQRQAGQDTKDQQKKQQKDKQASADKAKEQKQLARDATAREILDEEKKNKKERQAQDTGGYRPVEKDW